MAALPPQQPYPREVGGPPDAGYETNLSHIFPPENREGSQRCGCGTLGLARRSDYGRTFPVTGGSQQFHNPQSELYRCPQME